MHSLRRPAVAAKTASSEAETTVENDLYKLVFTNRGGQVKSWVLKKYNDDDGNPLDLVNKDTVKFGLPLSLYTYDENLRNQINSALYVSNASGNLTAPGELTFDYANGNVVVHKSFVFGTTYVISIETSVTQNGKRFRRIRIWPAAFGDETTAPGYATQKIEYMADGKVERLAPKKVNGGNTLRGPFNWAGPQDQFFAAIFLPDNPDTAAMVTLHESISVPKDPKKPDPNDKVKYDVLGAAVGDISGLPENGCLWVPRRSMSLNPFTPTPRPGDWTDPICATWWTSASFTDRPSALPLAEVDARAHGQQLGCGHHHPDGRHQPGASAAAHYQHEVGAENAEVAASDEGDPGKYKKYPMRDPKRQEMNTEIGELYKREGVNPAGGCLPLIIQMPFLFAFYSMLQNAIELRQAQFLWLHDLSSPDKMFVMPVLIVVSTYLVQKMTPNSGMDPKQQQMMTLMMPLMIGWFSFNLPSGLSVYWIIGNVIAIAQQYIMNRTGLGREMREEMEKRARKKAGK